MSKVLLINGSPNQKGCTYTALKEAADTLEKCGVETEIKWIAKNPLPGCIACRKCKKTGRCIFGDEVNDVTDQLSEIDGIIVGSPVYYASASGQSCSFLERLFFSAGDRLYGKPGAAVVTCRRGGAGSAFDRLNKFFSICNMPIVTSQYWNEVHGNNPSEIKQDAEGMQTMRTLAQNMAWLLKCLESGKAAGIELPKYEKPVQTNFINR